MPLVKMISFFLKKFHPAALGAAVCLLGLTTEALAVETRVIRDDSFSNFLEGESTGTELLSTGFLRVAPEAKQLEQTQDAVGWRVAVDRVDGQVFYATGHDGKIYRHNPGGKPELWAKLPEGQAISLVIDPTGTPVVGASPGGKIYRIVESGKPQLLFDTKEQYVWDLIFDRDGVLYAATGPNGKIFRIRGANNGEVLYDSDATNVMSLDFDREGNLLAATQGKGMVLRVNRPGEAYVMYTSPDDEVRALASDQETGTVYAGVNGTRAATGLVDATSADGKSPAGGDSDKTSARDSGSYLVEIQPSGFVTKYWSAPEGPVHTVLMDPTTSGAVLVAAGKKGRIYRVLPHSRYSVLADVVEPMVLSIAAGPGGETYFTTANKAALYRLATPNEKGLFASRTLNAGSTVRWGNLFFDAELTTGAAIAVETRSGNTPDATDKTWSAYTTATQTAGSYYRVESPVAQYLQYRLTLISPEADRQNAHKLLLDAVRVYYVQQNAPPVLRGINIAKLSDQAANPLALLAAAGRRPAPSPSGRSGGSGDADGADGDSGAAGRAGSSALRAALGIGNSRSETNDGPAAAFGADAPANTQKYRISWEASDPNNDRLLYTVHLKAEDEQVWRLIEEKIPATGLTLPTSSLADGKYRIQVEATDATANPEDSSSSTSLVSDLFTVDNTAPAITRLEAQPAATAGEWEVTASASDDLSIISGAEYAVGEIGEFQTVAPEDRVFDFSTETFQFRVRPEKAKSEHVLTLRVYDREGNAKVGKVLLK